MKSLQGRHSLGCRLVLIGLLVLLLPLLLWVGSMGILAFSLYGRAARLQQMVADPKSLNLTAVVEDVHGARQDLAILRSELAPVLWVGARLGGDLGAAEPLMDAAVESLVAADEASAALAPSLSDLTPASLSMSSIPRVLDALVAARPALERAQSHMNLAAGALTHIKGPLSPQMEKWVGQATKLVEMARQGVGVAQIAPELLAREGSRTYLVLVQNSDELRPTGGFISNIGRVEIKHGTVISQTFQDSYAVDDFTKNYPDPPKPLLDYMANEQWVFRDANWSPDFPTTARDAIRLYQISRPEQVDGVIAINQKAVKALIAGLEPLQVEGASEPITVANIDQMLQEAWKAGLTRAIDTGIMDDWYVNRKRFVGAAARAAMDKLFVGQVNWVHLAQGAIDAIRQRQLTIYTTGPEAARLKELGWDGAVRSNKGDYLMIVDSNVGYAKVAPLIDENAIYAVTLQPDGKGRANLSLSYKHKGTLSNVVCSEFVSYDEDLTYEKAVNRCYYDYLRWYVPQGSRLRGATPQPAPGKYLLSGKDTGGLPETLPDEAGHGVFAQFFILEYGRTLETRFDYELPTVVSDANGLKRYSLLLQKQSGTDALPVRVLLTLPPQARVVSADPVPTSTSPESLEFDLTLSIDRQIEVTYSSP